MNGGRWHELSKPGLRISRWELTLRAKKSDEMKITAFFKTKVPAKQSKSQTLEISQLFKLCILP